MSTTSDDPMTTIERLARVTNARDIEGIVACFADDYVLDAPTHPQRSFRGKEQVRRNWTQILGAVPDLAVRVVASARDDGTAWTEWEMSGTRHDGVAHLMRGVFVFGVSEGLVRWGRMFLEPVDVAGGNMSAAVREQFGGRPGAGPAEP